jgi:hypothetical protein
VVDPEQHGLYREGLVRLGEELKLKDDVLTEELLK